MVLYVLQEKVLSGPRKPCYLISCLGNFSLILIPDKVLILLKNLILIQIRNRLLGIQTIDVTVCALKLVTLARTILLRIVILRVLLFNRSLR